MANLDALVDAMASSGPPPRRRRPALRGCGLALIFSMVAWTVLTVVLAWLARAFYELARIGWNLWPW